MTSADISVLVLSFLFLNLPGRLVLQEHLVEVVDEEGSLAIVAEGLRALERKGTEQREWGTIKVSFCSDINATLRNYTIPQIKDIALSIILIAIH